MTVPNERTRAVKHTEQFLRELINPALTPRVPKSIRQQALFLLRHFPSSYEMDVIAEREDKDQKLPRIFGNGWY